MKKLIGAIVVLLLLGAAAFLISNSFLFQPTFNGNRVKNPDSYTLEFTKMNGEDSHSLVLSEDSELWVEFDIKKGDVDLVIGKEGEDPIYTGNKLGSGGFTLGIPSAGEYKITINASRGKGYIKIYAQ